jgi:peptide/nickel transport system ATP-binding protein
MSERTRILQVEHLNIYLKDRLIVKDLSFDLYERETLAMVGESGSGKTLTVMAILGILRGDFRISGKINYETELGRVNLLNCAKKEIERYRGNEISMVFQDPMTTLNPVLTCGEQISEVLIKHKKVSKEEAKKKSIEILKEVQLNECERIYNSYPYQLSGGQKQRVVIGMAIVCSPKILIADEPTTALDATTQKNILELLSGLKNKFNMSILFITHDLSLLEKIAEFVFVMKDGDMVDFGTVNNIINFPNHSYTMGLLSCRPNADLPLKILPTINDFGSNKVFDYYGEENRKQETAINLDKKLFQISNLSVEFGVNKGFRIKKRNSTKALENINFDIYKGETLGLLGSSGCGKSTIGKTIMKMVQKSSGDIIYKGRSIYKYKRKDLKRYRKEVQLIFQDPYASLNPKIPIGKQLIETMNVHKVFDNLHERQLFALELLNKVGLDEKYFYKYPHEFSGGQRQRIGIARILAVRPKFIICDESVSALDVSIQAQVLNLINQLKEEFGLTLLFISHDISVVRHMADRIIVMSKGKIEEINSTNTIWKNPQTEFTKQLLHNSLC